jgi:hypothetical protein
VRALPITAADASEGALPTVAGGRMFVVDAPERRSGGRHLGAGIRVATLAKGLSWR